MPSSNSEGQPMTVPACGQCESLVRYVETEVQVSRAPWDTRAETVRVVLMCDGKVRVPRGYDSAAFACEFSDVIPICREGVEPAPIREISRESWERMEQTAAKWGAE